MAGQATPNEVVNNGPISPFQSHYWQAIYDLESKDFETEMDIRYNEIDFSRLKSFCIFPLAGQPLQTAIVIDCMPGFKLIYRKEGVLHMGADPNNPGKLISRQGAYTFIMGLAEDDGSENLRLIEKGEICSLKTVDFRGGFRIILAPNGDLQAIGSYEVDQSEKDIGGQKVQFIHFIIKLDV